MENLLPLSNENESPASPSVDEYAKKRKERKGNNDGIKKKLIIASFNGYGGEW